MTKPNVEKADSVAQENNLKKGIAAGKPAAISVCMREKQVDYSCRICMSIEEAAEYSMLGENRLRRIIENDRHEGKLNWVLHVGERTRVKRIPFEQWVLEQEFIA